MNVTLDGFIETPEGSLDWGVVDEELHQWFADRMRPLSASLYGRRLYEVMVGYWPTGDTNPESTPAMREFAVAWQQTPKYVFSSTLDTVDPTSRLVRGEAADEVARLKAEIDGDMEVGGAALAGSLIRRGLVDEIGLVIHPVAIGAGKSFLPAGMDLTRLRLKETRVFGSGATYLNYEVERPTG
jgi:dihydrofolate reductase